MEFSEYNWATISETICPEMLIFGIILVFCSHVDHSILIHGSTQVKFVGLNWLKRSSFHALTWKD